MDKCPFCGSPQLKLQFLLDFGIRDYDCGTSDYGYAGTGWSRGTDCFIREIEQLIGLLRECREVVPQLIGESTNYVGGQCPICLHFGNRHYESCLISEAKTLLARIEEAVKEKNDDNTDL